MYRDTAIALRAYQDFRRAFYVANQSTLAGLFEAECYHRDDDTMDVLIAARDEACGNHPELADDIRRYMAWVDCGGAKLDAEFIGG